MSDDSERVFAGMAIDFWKLLRSYERLVMDAPAAATTRLEAQARFAAGRLAAHLESYGLQLVTFEGQPLSPQLPVVAINAEDLEGCDNLVIESTIEPAIVAGSRVVAVGRIIAREGEA